MKSFLSKTFFKEKQNTQNLDTKIPNVSELNEELELKNDGVVFNNAALEPGKENQERNTNGVASRIHNNVNNNLEQLQQNLDNLNIAKDQDEKATIGSDNYECHAGKVINHQQSTIIVLTDFGKKIIFDLDEVTPGEFIPHIGDFVSVKCNVKINDADKDQPERVVKVSPLLLESGKEHTVECVYAQHMVFSDSTYMLLNDVPKDIKFHLSDLVKVDQIKCNHGEFNWRAVKATLMEKNFARVNHEVSLQRNQTVITISGEELCTFTELLAEKEVTLKLENKSTNVVNLNKVEVLKKAEPQLSVVDPLTSKNIEVGGNLLVTLLVTAKFYGESKECLMLHFDNSKTKVKHSVTIIVCDSEKEAHEAESRQIAVKALSCEGNTPLQRMRNYTYKVWSQKAEVVPGECIATKRRFIAARIPFYSVPDDLVAACLNTDIQRCELREFLANEYPILNQPLSITNYTQRFSMLLHLEEIALIMMFRNHDRDRAHFKLDGEFLSLHVENLSERRPSLVVGDVVRAVNLLKKEGIKEKSFEGIIHKVLKDHVLLKFNATFHQNYKGEDYRLEFYFSRFTLRKEHFAVSRMLTRHRQYLFPVANLRKIPQLDIKFENDNMYLFDFKIEWCNPELNIIQKRAVYYILRGEIEKSPYVIFGPPGTGKTVTLVETILQLVRSLPQARLLVGAPSNSSADFITQCIARSNMISENTFVRLVSHNQLEKEIIPTDMLKYCATMDVGTTTSCKSNMRITESGLKLRCSKEYVGEHRIIIGTCSTLGNFLQMGFDEEHFTHVFIDEAGQTTEPEAVMTLALLSTTNSQIVLAGDPNQLQAIVMNRDAAEFGLSVSYLERILESSAYRKDILRYPETSGYNPHLVSKLLHNYRALPSIMKFYSKLFYDDELISMVSDENSREALLLIQAQKAFGNDELEMPLKHGVIFYGVVGASLQELDSPSWYNINEVEAVFRLVTSLNHLNVKPEQIGIMTPYTKQVRTLRNMFILSDLKMPKIGSVEDFQGLERDIVIISTVRSDLNPSRYDSHLNLGFVSCPKRMNVAISRARSMLVIFGNPHVLSLDKRWRHLILYCANNNAYFGCDLPQMFLPHNEEVPKMELNRDDTYGCVP